jgi:predicted DNA-binding protein with PD1-like motif
MRAGITFFIPKKNASVREGISVMQYTEGTFGRVFQVRVDHGEDLLDSIEAFVRDKGIRCGFAQFIGALKGGRIVTGPKELILPPDPSFESYEDGWEVFGFASITPGESGPHLHYHASIGRNREVLTGCLRERATVYIIVEVLIVEVTGSTVARKKDPATGLELPFFGNQSV